MTMKILYPKIGNVEEYNEFTDDQYRGFQCRLDTTLMYIYDDGYRVFTFQILGFGIRIKNQKLQ